jgi:hypothetical protein
MAQKYDVVLAPAGADVVTRQRFAAETDAFAGLFTALPLGGIVSPVLSTRLSVHGQNACRKQSRFLFYRSLD